jgi:hypothetical protein
MTLVKRTIVLAGAFLAVAVISLSQSYNLPVGRLYEIRDSMNLRFDSLSATLPDSVFFSEGGEYAEFQRWYKQWMPKLAPYGDFNRYGLISKNYSDLNFFGGSHFKSNMNPWTELGPKRRRNNMLGIGPVRNIIINPENPLHMMCNSRSGGLFYTQDGAQTWDNAGTDLGWPHSGCQDAAYYPGQTSYWFGLSAYEYPYSNSLSYLGGVYRSLNEGGEWTRIGDYNDFGNSSTEVIKLLFDRKLVENDHRLFLATSRGIYISDNPMASDPFEPNWFAATIITPPTLDAIYPNHDISAEPYVNDIEFLPWDPNNQPSTLCAAMRFSVFLNDALVAQVWRFMISLTNGLTWHEIGSQPPIDLSISWASVETTPANPESFYCHAVKNQSWVQSYNASLDTWTSIIGSGNTSFYPDFGRGHAFAVDLSNPSSVYVGDDIEMSWYVSGTKVLNQFNTGHDDVEDIVCDPLNPGKLWIANHGGVYYVDPTIPSYTDKSDELGVAEVWDMSTSQNKPDYVALGLYHNCNYLTRTPYQDDWDPDWGYLNLYGDGTMVMINPKDANVVYFANQFYISNATWARNDNAESTSLINSSWSIVGQYHQEGALNRQYPDHVYGSMTVGIGGPIEVWRSLTKGLNRQIVSDFANNMEVNNPNFTGGGEQFWWLLSNPANPNHLYVGLQNWHWQQRIFRNLDVDNSDLQLVRNAWQEVPHPRRAPLYAYDPEREPVIQDLAFDVDDENIVYVAYASSKFLSPTDFEGPLAQKMVYKLNLSYPDEDILACSALGACQDITMNLPNSYAAKNSLEFEQGTDGGIYVALESGIYFTNNKRIKAYDQWMSNNTVPESADDMNNSTGWVKIGGGLPHVISNGLEINYQANVLRVGTLGRGVWQHSLFCPPEPADVFENIAYTEDAFIEVKGNIQSTATVESARSINYRGGTEVRLLPGFHASDNSYFHAFIHPCNLPGNSMSPKNEILEMSTPIVSRREEETGLVLFPNPTSGMVTIRSLGLKDGQEAVLRILDLTGSEVYIQKAYSSANLVSLELSSGVYRVVLTSGNLMEYGHLIITRQ